MDTFLFFVIQFLQYNSHRCWHGIK